jgi:hypothetical protein
MYRKIVFWRNASGRAMLLAVFISTLSLPGLATQAQVKKPISETGLVEALRIGGLTVSELVREVQQRGVNFKLTGEIEMKLRRAGATAALIRAVGANYRVQTAPVNPERGAAVPPAKPAAPPPVETPRVALGLVVQDLSPSLAAMLGLGEARGVLVSAVGRGGLAAAAGAERRDVITALNNAPVKDIDGLRRGLARLRPDETISLNIIRDGAPRKLIVGESPAPRNNQPAAGVVVAERVPGVNEKLGLKAEPPTQELAARYGLSKVKGLVVTHVAASGLAWAGGVKGGDVLEEINGVSLRAVEDIERALAKTKEGRVRLRVKREGKSFNLDLQLRT